MRKRTGLIISLTLPTISRFVQICHLPPIHYTLRRATFPPPPLYLALSKSAICPLYIIPSAMPLLLLRYISLCPNLPSAPYTYSPRRATFSLLHFHFTSLCPRSAICPLYIIPSTVPLFFSLPLYFVLCVSITLEGVGSGPLSRRLLILRTDPICSHLSPLVRCRSLSHTCHNHTCHFTPTPQKTSSQGRQPFWSAPPSPRPALPTY